MDLIYSLVNAGANAVADAVRDISTVVSKPVTTVVNAGIAAGQAAGNVIQQAANDAIASAKTPLDRAMQDPDTAAAVLTINAFNDAGVIKAYVDNAGYVQQGSATDYLGNALAGLEAGMRRYIDGGLNAVTTVINGIENNVSAFINEARKLLEFANSFSAEMLQDAFQIFVSMFWDGLAEAL